MTTGSPLTPNIKVHSQAFDRISELALGSTNEVGGILVGWWQGSSTAVVYDFLEVHDANSGINHYVRSYKEAQESLTALLSGDVDPRIGYIGEWHSHLRPRPPSRTDKNALASISREHGRPISLIVLAIMPGGKIMTYGLISRIRWDRRVQMENVAVTRINDDETSI